MRRPLFLRKWSGAIGKRGADFARLAGGRVAGTRIFHFYAFLNTKKNFSASSPFPMKKLHPGRARTRFLYCPGARVNDFDLNGGAGTPGRLSSDLYAQLRRARGAGTPGRFWAGSPERFRFWKQKQLAGGAGTPTRFWPGPPTRFWLGRRKLGWSEPERLLCGPSHSGKVHDYTNRGLVVLSDASGAAALVGLRACVRACVRT